MDGVSDRAVGFPLMALQDRMELKVYGAKCILRVCTEAGWMCRMNMSRLFLALVLEIFVTVFFAIKPSPHMP